MNLNGIKEKKFFGSDYKSIYMAFSEAEAENYLKAFKEFRKTNEPESYGLLKFEIDSKDVFVDWESGLGQRLQSDSPFMRKFMENPELHEAVMDVMSISKAQDNTHSIKYTYPICKFLGKEEFSEAIWGVSKIGKKIPISDVIILKEE